MLPRETSDSPLQPDVSTVDKAARKIDRNSGILSDRSLFWSIFMHPFSSARLHRLIQLGFFLFLSWVAWRLHEYAQGVSGNGAFVPRPAAAEAFLPLSALLGLKRFLLTGQYDPIHPAGLTILLVALCTAILCRRGFCGSLCPVGWLSGLLARLGTRLGVSCRPGRRLEWLLSAPKYVLLAAILYSFVVSMDLPSIEWFLKSPYNLVADIKMLQYFLAPGTLTLGVIVVMVLGSIFLPGFWCRGFCPYGALLGLLSLLSPMAVNRNPASCSGCGRCAAACPSRIPVDGRKRLSGPECMGCTECVSACPSRCLDIRFGYGTGALRLPAWGIAAGTLLILLIGYAAAVFTGHWEADLPPQMIRMFLN